MLEDVLAFLVGVQTRINASVGADLRAFAATRNWLDLAAVLPVGIAFGAVHALTPGHSKAILATYLAGSRHSLARAAGVASVLSLTHIITAVVIASLALPIITRTFVGAGRAPLLEDVSRGLLAVVGIWMILRALMRSLYAKSHAHPREGLMVGVTAGLIPCPLTLFTMTLAMARGVPEAGLAFALAMMLGVAFTLSCVAMLAVAARDRMAFVLVRHGSALGVVGRTVEIVAGLLLVAFGLSELIRR